MAIRFLMAMQVLLVVLLVHASHVVAANGEYGNGSIICKERERKALLSLKNNFTVHQQGVLSSWSSGENHAECCKWEGVTCNDQTGHVVQLQLQDIGIGGIINPSLVELHHLIHLDLSGFANNFTLIPFPKFIASLTHLEYLDLSSQYPSGQFPNNLYNLSKLVYLNLGYNNFTGKIPYNIANLTRLQFLDLSGNCIDGGYDPHTLGTPPLSLRSDLEWVSNMKSLKTLNLNCVDLSSAYNWLQQVTNLSLLQELNLAFSNLQDRFSSSFNVISTTLDVVDLSQNNLTSSSILKSFLDVCSLSQLDLSSNKLSGRLDEFIHLSSKQCANKQLELLFLENNQFTGSVPNLSSFPSLEQLLVNYNRLNGTVSESIWELSKLTTLSVSHNSLHGVISEAHLSKLSNLYWLDLSFNGFIVNLSKDWTPPFQIMGLFLASCKLGPHFPRWLRTQKSISKLDISNNEIIDTIPNWLLADYKMTILNLSHNQISGEIASLPLKYESSKRVIFGEIVEIDFSYNMLEGRIPSFLSMSTTLDLSNNKFLEANSFICSNKTRDLYFLDLSNNQLTGMLPECWTSFEKLGFLNLENNSFTGNIPSSMGFLTHIELLHLGNNNFMGEIPLSLSNCRELRVLDVAKNNLSGLLPIWIGGWLQKLQILILRSNKFHGCFPSSLCDLPKLLLLDLSFNNISGSIPNCLNKLSTLASQSNSSIIPYLSTGQYVGFGGLQHSVPYSDSESLVWKGKERTYHNTLGLMRSIDISSNSFNGKIPYELMNLTALVSLNISRNKLSGEIPSTIGQLKSLDALDLSRNHLSGKIPSEFSQLGFLGVLDLSYNNLSGEIPDVTTLQGFEPSTYLGNPELCGAPLSKCPTNQTDHHDENEKHNFISGFHISVILGFIVGFWGVFVSLLLKKSWRYAYFKFFEDLYDKLYVFLAIRIRRIKAML